MRPRTQTQRGCPPPVPAAIIAVAGRGELYTARVARIPRCAALCCVL